MLYQDWIEFVLHLLKHEINARLKCALQEGLLFLKVASPLGELKEGQFTKKRNRTGTKHILEDSHLVVGQSFLLQIEPCEDNRICSINTKLVKMENVLSLISKSSQKVLLFPGQVTVLLLLLK